MHHPLPAPMRILSRSRQLHPRRARIRLLHGVIRRRLIPTPGPRVIHRRRLVGVFPACTAGEGGLAAAPPEERAGEDGDEEEAADYRAGDPGFAGA